MAFVSYLMSLCVLCTATSASGPLSDAPRLRGRAQLSERPWRHLIAKYQPTVRDSRGLRRLAWNADMRQGIDFATLGYNLWLGNPSPTQGSVDPGFQKQIFEAVYTGGETADGRYSEPDGMTVLPCDGSCALRTHAKEIKGKHDYYDDLRTKVGFDVSIFGASFGASFDFKRISKGSTENDERYTKVEATCCSYKVQVNTFKPPELSGNFLAAIDWLPTDYDQKSYFEVIQEFGSHYVSSAELGGAYGQESTFTRNNWEDMTSASFDWNAYAEASFIVSISANAGQKDEDVNTRTFQSYTESQKIYSIGQRPPADPTKWSSWLERRLESPESPAPIKTDIQPITELFSSRFFKHAQAVDASQLDAKQANMARALAEYCQDYLLPSGQIDSCEAPGLDAPMPGPEKTCLSSASGGGGSGGNPFDDRSLISLRGLYSDLDIVQLDFKAGTRVESLQIKLNLMNNTWPLNRHGSQEKSGIEESIPFLRQGVGDAVKVIAVKVRHCSYVNGLTFYSDDGQEHTIGGSGGCETTMVNFQEEILKSRGFHPRAAWLVGFSGRADKWIDSIGFHFAYTVPEGTDCGDDASVSTESTAAAPSR